MSFVVAGKYISLAIGSGMKTVTTYTIVLEKTTRMYQLIHFRFFAGGATHRQCRFMM